MRNVLVVVASIGAFAGACATSGDAVIGAGDADGGAIEAGEASTPAACGGVDQVCCGADGSKDTWCRAGTSCVDGTCRAGDAGPPDACTEICAGGCADTAIDPQNCGRCGNACAQDQACQSGQCVCVGVGCATDGGLAPTAVATAQTMPASIAVDGARVYWTTWPSQSAPASSVFACPLAGCGAAPTELASHQSIDDWIQDLVVTPSWVYWGAGAGGVMRCASTTCASAATFATATSNVAAVAADATHVYWGSQSDGAIWRCPVGPSCPSPEIVSPARQSGGWVSSIALDDANVYWIDVDSSGIMAHPKQGGTMTTLATDVFSPTALVAAGGRVFWTSGGTAIRTVASNGGSASPYVWDDKGPYDVATDGAFIYWTDNIVNVKGSIRKCAVGQVCTSPITLATGLDTAFALAVDATTVYFTTNTAPNGTVMRVPKE